MKEAGEILFDIQNISFAYNIGKQKIKALKAVNFQIYQNAFLCLIGPSGSGKTTLLSLLGLMENIQEGNLLYRNESIRKFDDKRKNYIRRHELGFVFQQVHLFPILTAAENVEFFLTRQGIKSKERLERTEEALKLVGIWEQRHQKPLEMSGGQCQRIAIARALAKNPKVIIADEPTASLDQKTGNEIMNIFSNINQEKKTTIILTSHDPMVHGYAKETVMMKDGIACL